MFGKRVDGRRIKGVDPIVQITPYLMPMRCDAQVFLQHRVDMDRMNKYIRKLRQERNETVTHMQLFIAAYVRSVSKNPEVNRFIMNRRFYARNNLSCAFTILKDPGDYSQGEAVVKLKFDPYDTLFDVRDRFNAAVDAERKDTPSNVSNKLASAVFKVPGLPSFLVALVKFLDKHDMCPKILIEELPFYVGAYITNTASIGLHHVNHHIYNFGNVGMFFSLGTAEQVAVTDEEGTSMKRFLPIGIVVDERVCAGAYYAKFFADMKYFLNHPEDLEVPPESVRFDKDCEYSESKVNKE